MGDKFQQLSHKSLEQDDMEGVEDHEWVCFALCQYATCSSKLLNSYLESKKQVKGIWPKF